jgi:hypothetical protein
VPSPLAQHPSRASTSTLGCPASSQEPYALRSTGACHGRTTSGGTLQWVAS